MKLEHFYAILKSAAAYYPPSTDRLPCKQLQSFKVFGIDRAIELTAPNAGATVQDKNGPYFYSRAWERSGYNPNEIVFDFPALGVVPLSIQKRIRAGNTRAQYLMQLSVISVKKDIADCVGYTDEQIQCATRNVNQIYADCEKILGAVLTFLNNVVYVDFVTGSMRSGWYFRPALQDALSKGLIGDYNEMEELSEYVSFDGGIARYDFVEMNGSGHYGMATTLRLENIECVDTEICVPITPDQSGIIGNEAGCLTCG